VPMTPAGARDKRVTFQRATTTRSALGGKTASSAAWSALGTRWAKVLYGTGAERRTAAVEQGVQAITVRCLADSLTRTVLVTDRMVHGGLTYDITGIVPVGQEFEFTGTASRG
jgi:head-tail adaptor